MQNVDVLVKKTDNLLLPGQTITGVSGETVNVEPVTPPTGDQAASTGETQGEEAKTEGENDENNTENQQEGESGAVSDNTAQDGGANETGEQNLQVVEQDANITAASSAPPNETEAV